MDSNGTLFVCCRPVVVELLYLSVIRVHWLTDSVQKVTVGYRHRGDMGRTPFEPSRLAESNGTLFVRCRPVVVELLYLAVMRVR